jgi:hypothetical protein
MIFIASDTRYSSGRWSIVLTTDDSKPDADQVRVVFDSLQVDNYMVWDYDVYFADDGDDEEYRKLQNMASSWLNREENYKQVLNKILSM